MMKKYFLLFLICLIASMLKAQLVNQNDQSVKSSRIWIGIIAPLIETEFMVRK